MPKRIAVSTLNASTIDILNTIRANASLQYQNSIPEITVEQDIPRVGEVLYGYPALANEFVSSLVNRIAFVSLTSATFNNRYAMLKKGQLEFGETVEEVFTDIINAIAYSAEKAEARELKRYLPNVRTAFHAMNWKVLYPITIQEKDLRLAFISAQGVQDLIADIIDKVYTSNEYDEFLLFKYLLIKGVAHGQFAIEPVDTTNITNAAKAFRAVSNKFDFMSPNYNEAHVRNTCPRERQQIFMDADFNAAFDVDVLSAAFNMDKADFMGRLQLIDDFTSFDNERFELIRAESDELDEITKEELNLMKDVKAILVDERWFQVYDNLNVMTEKEVAAGLYWNYFYHVWKTISHSPFSNAVVFVESGSSPLVLLPASVVATIVDKSVDANGTTVLSFKVEANGVETDYVEFIQTQDATTKGVAVHRYGAVIIPEGVSTVTMQVAVSGVEYQTATLTVADADVDITLNFAKQG